MALDLSKLNFFNRLDARSRIFFLTASVVAVLFLVYLGTRLLSSRTTTGASRVASAPQGLQSVQGGQLTPEYYRALQQANLQSAQQAQVTGGSAIPTQINIGGQGANCIICSDQSANVKNYLDDWARQGKVSPDVANELEQLANKNVTADEYAAALDRLVKQGKLTPEQARQLLAEYKKQHANALLADSAKMMDDMIKAGTLPLDVANQLLDAQKNNVSPADYAAQLQGLVAQGKIAPADAQRLLSQYTQQRAKEIVMKSIVSLQQMAGSGQLTPDVEKDLIDLEYRMVPVDLYAATLQKYVAAGKLTPIVSDKILTEFKSQKAAIGPTATIDQLLQQAEAAAYAEINDLVKAGKMPADVGAQLIDMIQKNVSLEQYVAFINMLVKQNKITADIAKLKIADYQLVKGLREEAQRLAALQGNNATPEAYSDELKRAVQAGILTPDQAAQLMQEYQALTARPLAAPANIPGTAQFQQLQQQIQGAAPTPTTAPNAAEFAVAQTQAEQESAQDRMARIQALAAIMSNQAQALVAAWQTTPMVHREGAPPSAGGAGGGKAGTGEGAGGKKSPFGGLTEPMGPPLIKAGTILFAVLDTAVNSDYPDTPVLATIVAGPLKGAKLLGKLMTAKSVAGQLDRVSLDFTLMNKDDWTKSKTVMAFAIDPDTARTAIASHVNYHYLKRFGAIMATSFLQGYSTAITNAGTSTTGIFGTSTTHPQLSPTSKIAVGLGQVGQTLGAATQNYINIPPTVKVDSGVGLGILFMSDVNS